LTPGPGNPALGYGERNGFADVGCVGSATLAGGPAGGNGNGNGTPDVASVLSGNTVSAPISAPVNVFASLLGLVGFANSSCTGGPTTTTCTHPHPHPHPHLGPGPTWTPTGSGSGATTSTVPGGLPITGANLLGRLAAALVSVGVGAAW